MGTPFRLLEQLYADPVSREIWSADSTIWSWLQVEREIARAQAHVGLISDADAASIAAACEVGNITQDDLWDAARNVGYPILGLVRAISSQLPAGPDGRVHYGATTQDIMDTGLSLQLVRSCDHLESQIVAIGNVLAARVAEHRDTVMPARTHAQQAVPTTLGAKLAVYLSQFTDCVERLRDSRAKVGQVSLYGAGGTNAAMAPHGVEVRRIVAGALGLRAPEVPWHVARHRIVDFAQACAITAAVCVRFAREVVDLSRNEIGEVMERPGHHRGASSTMPQKSNPISSESIVGFGIATEAEAAGLMRCVEAGHERSAGEWQAEWVLVPQVVEHTASALGLLRDLVSNLAIDKDAMRANLGVDSGLLMSEALMMHFAQALGREQAHDLMYEAARTSRRTGEPLAATMTSVLARRGMPDLLDRRIRPEDYLGEAHEICDVARVRWASTTREPVRSTDEFPR